MSTPNATTENTKKVRDIIELWKGEKCKEIKTIQKYIRKWQENKNKLEPIAYRGDKIKINDINVFTYKNRSNNDIDNKKRENIIVCIINKTIPEQYYKLSLRWHNLRNGISLMY